MHSGIKGAGCDFRNIMFEAATMHPPFLIPAVDDIHAAVIRHGFF